MVQSILNTANEIPFGDNTVFKPLALLANLLKFGPRTAASQRAEDNLLRALKSNMDDERFSKNTRIQEDSVEYALALMQQLQREYAAVSNKGLVDEPMQKLFGFTQAHCTECARPSCSFRCHSDNNQAMMITHTLAPGTVIDLQQVVHRFMQQQNHPQYQCAGCNELTGGHTFMYQTSAPEMQLIHVNRTQLVGGNYHEGGTSIKCHSRVVVLDHLEIFDSVPALARPSAASSGQVDVEGEEPPVQESPGSVGNRQWSTIDGCTEAVSYGHVRRLLDTRKHGYDLVALILHLGQSMSHGHYVTMIKEKGDDWIQMSDRLVEKVSFEQVCERSADTAVLFMLRKSA